MALRIVVLAGGILLAAASSQFCGAEGRWGIEVSGRLDELGVVRTYSLKNEFHLRLYWDWDECLRSDTEETQRTEYADTTVTEEYSVEGDESWGSLTLEAAFFRNLRSGAALSPSVGLIARFRPYRDWESYDQYRPDGLRSQEERSWNTYSVSIVLTGGVRWFFNGDIAVSAHTDLVAYTHYRETRESTYRYPASDEIRVSERTRTRDSVSFTMQPTVYLQYYF
jgi:hypothetical protein